MQAAGLNAASTSTAKPKDTLWVDRYRPKRFTELLGDERLHREVMAWVKEWDPCVFGVRKNKKRSRDEEETNLPPDPFHRPQEKVGKAFDLLLCWTTMILHPTIRYYCCPVHLVSERQRWRI